LNQSYGSNAAILQEQVNNYANNQSNHYSPHKQGSVDAEKSVVIGKHPVMNIDDMPIPAATKHKTFEELLEANLQEYDGGSSASKAPP